jgi:diacylglycerol kinase family enzyme
MWAARVGLSFRPFRLTVEDGHTSATAWASEVRIANGGFFGGVELVEDADFASGEIIVQVVTGKSNRNLASSWISNMLRLRNRDQWQAEIRAKKLRIETEPAMDVSIDGELAARTPITVSVVPGAVEIAAPKENANSSPRT